MDGWRTHRHLDQHTIGWRQFSRKKEDPLKPKNYWPVSILPISNNNLEEEEEKKNMEKKKGISIIFYNGENDKDWPLCSISYRWPQTALEKLELFELDENVLKRDSSYNHYITLDDTLVLCSLFQMCCAWHFFFV